MNYLINRYIDLNYFNSIRNTNFIISCTDIHKQWYINIENKIHIIDSIPKNIDLHISSTCSGFLKFILNKNISEINISGNLEIADKLQNLFLEFNLEKALSHYIGNILAYQIIKITKQVCNIDLFQMILEYVTEEIKILPTKYEVNIFLHNIDILRIDVEKLVDRIQKHESNY